MSGTPGPADCCGTPDDPGPDRLAELAAALEFPDPRTLRLPLGPVPSDGEQLKAWLELYTRQLDVVKSGAELAKTLQDAERSARKAQIEAERAEIDLRKARVAEAREAERAELELAAARRADAAALAEPAQALVYTFYGDIEPDSVREAVTTLGAWSRRAPNQPLRVVLNSEGGTAHDGLALHDFLLVLRAAGHHVQVLTLGVAASVAAVLLQAGDERLLGRNAMVLIHEVSTVAAGKASELTDRAAFVDMLQGRLLTILAERSTLSIGEIRDRWERRDWWLTAPEAVALGFADRVV